MDPAADGEPKEVDHLLSVLTQQVGAQNPPRPLLDERLETRMSQPDPSRGVPVRGVSLMCRKAQALGVGNLFGETHSCQWRSGEDHTGDAGVVRGSMVPLEQVAG